MRVLQNPGGSSSGSAVAVAAGFAPLAIGTDTMGSLMVPAERAALYAIKPTIKLVPQEGLIPVTPEADAAGPMAKSVLDLADLLDVLVDAGKTKVPEEGYRAAVTGSWGNIRIGVVEPEKWMFDEMVTKYEEAATEQMVRLSVHENSGGTYFCQVARVQSRIRETWIRGPGCEARGTNLPRGSHR